MAEETPTTSGLLNAASKMHEELSGELENSDESGNSLAIASALLNAASNVPEELPGIMENSCEIVTSFAEIRPTTSALLNDASNMMPEGLSSEIVTSLAEKRIIALVPERYLDITISITNLAFSLANSYLLPCLSTAIGISINPLSAIDMNALALAQIKNKLESMDKKLDTLLTSEMKLAIKKCDTGLYHLNKFGNENNVPDVKHRAAKDAIEEFR